MLRYAMFAGLGLGLGFVVLVKLIFAILGLSQSHFLGARGLVLLLLAARKLLTGEPTQTRGSMDMQTIGAAPIGVALVVATAVLTTPWFWLGVAEILTMISLGYGLGGLLGKYLGLSVAADAFLVGAWVGDTEHSAEIVEALTPMRDAFTAIFFVTTGVLVKVL